MTFNPIRFLLFSGLLLINFTTNPNEKTKIYDAIKGSILLGAYGDAQARVTEFWTSYDILHKYRPDDTDNLPKIPSLKTLKMNKSHARFTDDTHMSLYLAHALLQTYNQPISIIIDSITDNLIAWIHADQTERAPGIAATNNALCLEELKAHGIKNMQLWSRNHLSTISIDQPNDGLRTILYNNEGGSGAVMRTAPVSFFYYKNPALAEQLSIAQGILTHTDSGSRAACAGFNAVLCALLNQKNNSLDELLDQAILAAQRYDNRPYMQSYLPRVYSYGQSHLSQNGCAAMCQKVKEYIYAGLSQKPYHEVLDEFRGWGATEALAASLYIFVTWNHDPYTAMNIAINRTPGDSDTIAKMVGELLGAQYGYNYLKKNFDIHGINLDQEITYLENIYQLSEYHTDFTSFKRNQIATFDHLAQKIALIQSQVL